MVNLKNSRGKFFETHKMPRDRTFWQYFLECTGRFGEIPDRDKEIIHHLGDRYALIVQNSRKQWSYLIGNLPVEWRKSRRQYIRRSGN